MDPFSLSEEELIIYLTDLGVDVSVYQLAKYKYENQTASSIKLNNFNNFRKHGEII